MPDYNGMNIPLMAAGMDRYHLFDILDEMRLLNVKVLAEHGDAMDPETRERLQRHCDLLKPILNPVYRPKGIESDPFVPRYCADRIEYFANEVGYAIVVSEKGMRVLKPTIVPHRAGDVAAETAGETRETVDLTAFKSEALEQASAMAVQWELPLREPYFGESPSLDELIRASLPNDHAPQSAPAPRF